jgi:hypothetical protein
VTTREGGREIIDLVCDVRAIARPDAGTVDRLARLALVTRRAGCRIVLRHAAPALRELIALMGLCDVLPLEGERQAEQREERRRVEEEVAADDPSV